MNTKKSYCTPATLIQSYCAAYLLSGSSVNPFSVTDGPLTGGDTGGDAGGGL